VVVKELFGFVLGFFSRKGYGETGQIKRTHVTAIKNHIKKETNQTNSTQKTLVHC